MKFNFLFIRGLARHSGHWYNFEKRFQTETNQVLLIDLPGNGRNNHLDSPRSINECTLFARECWIEKKVNNQFPWVIISISMGGMVALDWLSQYPEDFKKIFVINTSASDLVKPWERFSIQMLSKLPMLILSDDEAKEKAILEVTLSKRSLSLPLLNEALKFKDQKTSHANFFRQLYSASKFKVPTNLPSNKIVIINGGEDKLVSPKASENLAKLLKAPLFINKEAGHDLPLDDSFWLEQIILENI